MDRPERGTPHSDGVLLETASLKHIDAVVHRAAAKDVSVTFLGETGTGKEVFARRLHGLSARSAGPFVAINCAAIPDALVESELFGHQRGAFTGAVEHMKGKVASAEGGTLFLDEISEMTPRVQAKLLRFVEARAFMRLGSSVKHRADVRLVFATHRQLEDEVRTGRLRADFYYRIRALLIRIPPLRERRGDIPLFTSHFIQFFARRHHTPVLRLSRAARNALLAYDWPGNVRELRNVIESLSVLSSGKLVRVRDLPDAMQARAGNASHSHALTIDLDVPLRTNVERIIEGTLALEKGSRSRAAERLGVSVRTIDRYLAHARGGEHRSRKSN